MAANPKKLVLAVIDSLKPDMLDLAIEEGRAPALAALRGHGRLAQDAQTGVLLPLAAAAPEQQERESGEGQAPALAALLDCGTYVRDCISTFPSVTPVASAAIATGCGPGEHHIPSMNWFHRGEERYVEYGSSLQALSLIHI